MGKYFTIKELYKSSIANQNDIDNRPNEEITNNLLFIIDKLDAIREDFGKPIYVNSGYRCPKLNNLVGGVENSAHLQGLAADITSSNNKRLFDLIKDNFEFDKLINEHNYSWIHIQFRPKNNRNIVLHIN